MSKKRKPKTIVQVQAEIQKAQEQAPEIPYYVWTTFHENQPAIEFAHNQVCIGSDYKTVGQVREALNWYVEQFGGEVSWK